MNRQWRYISLLAVLLTVFTVHPAGAEPPDIRTPDEVCERMNVILSPKDGGEAAPFAEMVVFDDAGGFDFCSMDGERRLDMGHISAYIRGHVDEDGHMCELSLIMQPSRGFGRGYSMQADRLSRIYMLSLFDALSESDLDLLMNSYLYDICPYRYKDGDSAVGRRTRMCEIELGGEIVRVDSEAAEDNALMLKVTFPHDADEATRERARENGWRILRLSQAASECEMIQTCGDCLTELEMDGIAGDQEDIGALLELAGQSAEAICGMQTERMHAQERFLLDLQTSCGQLISWTDDYNAACEEGDIAAARLYLQEICRISSEIGCMPETLY